MAAILSLLGNKYVLIGLALAAFLGLYTLHERNIQHAKDISAAAKVVTKDNKIVAAGTATAQVTETQNALIFKQAVAIPPVGDLGIVCQRPARSVPLPTTGALPTPGAGERPVDGGEGPAFDPSGALLTRAREADAEIAYLQGRVHELEAQMAAAP